MMPSPGQPPVPDLTRLTARSVVLSMLLGTHPAWASAGELVRLAGDFGIKESTLRVALTRMVGAGDLIRSADGYRLAERLLARQRRQDEAVHPRTQGWSGEWTTLVVTRTGIDARTRSAMRTALQHQRFGELREGVWLRPDNLHIDLEPGIRARLKMLRARDDDPAQLAGQLWDLPRWAAAGDALLAAMATADGRPDRFVVAAAIVRHLLTDPVLPEELLPAGWPGKRLRDDYFGFVADFGAWRRQSQPMEAI